MIKKILNLVARPGGRKILWSKMKIRSISSHRSYAFEPWPLDADILDVHPKHLMLTEAQVGAAQEFNRMQTVLRQKFTATPKIAWFLPDFEAGGGGHMNIFRCQKFLKAKYGIESANVVYPGRASVEHPKQMKEFYEKKAQSSFPTVYDQTPFLQEPDELKNYSVLMATNWASVFGVVSRSEGLLRTYFMQDYEPYFYGEGARTAFARQSYELGLLPICAGPWIPRKLGLDQKNEDYISYQLSSELDRYQEVKSSLPRKGICLYVRSHTERRGYELAVGVIEYLKIHRPDIALSTIGMPSADLNWLKGCHHYGSRSVSELPAIYSSHRVFGVFSFSNYSLLPAEIISCGSPVVDVDLENNQAVESLFPRSHYQLSKASVEKMALKLIEIHDRAENQNQEELNAWKQQFGGWDVQYQKIADGLKKQFPNAGF